MKKAALHLKYALFFIVFFIAFFAVAEEKSVITIEKAQRSETRKNKLTDSDVIIFSGGVVLSVVKGEIQTNITAETVQYDRARQMLYAQDGVELQKSSNGNLEETVTANSLLFNVTTLEGVFDDGRVIQHKGNTESSGTTLLVASEIFGRNDSGTVAFKGGVITFCDDPNPHWKIKATRIWLLPGNEFAFFNGRLFVGATPVLWLPFFYYPKDELVFNPAFGFRPREGFFTQTTTYIIGRKPQNASAAEGIFSFTQNTGQAMEQKLDGLFLRDTDKKLAETPQNMLKIMADIYSSLGFFVGVEGLFKPKKVVNSIEFALDFGFSKTLFPVSSSNVYVPYNPDSGKTTWNSSQLFGVMIPFRYTAHLKTNMSTPLFSLNFALPLYSDPYFKDDFFKRKESMDWIGYLTENVGLTNETINTNDLVTSFNWAVSGSFTPKIPILSPYVSSLEISSFNVGVDFSSKTDSTLTGLDAVTSPLRTFYFPQVLTPLRFSAKIGGSLVNSTGNSKSISTQKSLQSVNVTAPQDLQPKEKQPETDKKDEAENTITGLPLELFPDLKLASPQITPINGVSYSLNYSITPNFSSQNMYPSTTLQKPSDIRWSQFASTYYSIGGTAELANNLGWRNNFVSMSNRFVFQPQYQKHPFISDAYYGINQKDQIILGDYAAQKLDLVNANTVSLKPFVFSNYFSDTSIYWTITTKIIRTEFTGTVQSPDWKYHLPTWEPNSFTEHTMNLNLAAKQDDMSQSLLLSANLPPLAQNYNARLTLNFLIFQFTAASGIKKNMPSDKEWIFNPFQQTAAFYFFDKKWTINQTFQYDLQKKNATSLQISTSAFGAQVSYSMLYTNTYKLDQKTGWVLNQEQKFIPQTLGLRYSTPNKTFYFWKNRIQLTPTLSTALNFDLIRQTSSYFTFSPSIAFKIHEQLTITFASESRNNAIFRYFQNMVGFTPKIPGEQNMFIDLFNSFAFWDENKRISSGFKLSSLSVKLEHNLHDWTLSSELKINPRLLYTSNARPYYDITPFFTVSVVWKPLSAMKTTIVDDYGTFKLNP